MSKTQNGGFHLHETWAFIGTINDSRSKPLSIDGATVYMRIVQDGAIKFDLSTSDGGVIINAEKGEYQFVITPDQQKQANISTGSCNYEVKAVLSNGVVSIQTTGKILIAPSLFDMEP